MLDPRAVEETERQDKHRNESLAEACGDLEEDLEALRARYEMYFLGVERREPAREREEIKRRVARLKGEFTRNTGLRFRIETLHARYISYERMWLRSAREKEAGTYRRDVLKARRKAELQAQREAEAPGAAAEAPSAPKAESAPPPAASERAAPPPPGPIAARPAQSAATPSAGAGAGMSEPQLRALYDAYVGAKKRCNEDVTRITYEGLARSVARQVPELIAKYKAKSVEFKVVIKDGRAILKAIPRV
jgi:hypothetical protein